MHHKKEGFARLALTAKSPVDLGTRCSTFIDSRVKHAQKEGVTPEDIAAGVCYSTVRNALYKVVRQPDFTKVGKHIVVQGGAFANDAILRAFELETGVEVKRPDLSQLMGAWGAALLARDEWLAQGDPDAKSTLIGAADIGRMRIQKTTRMCDQCTNHCMLTLTRFTDKDTQHGGAWTQETPGRSSLKQSYGRSAAVADDGHAPLEDRLYVTGNRCERGLAAIGEAPTNLRKPPNMVKLKNALIAACDRKQPAALDKNQPVVGIPRTLALYESYPFWHAFFTTLGVRVVPAGASTEDLYRKGMASIAAEGSCYPSKLLYGHAIDLAERGAEVLFVPTLTESFAREGLLGISLSKNQPKSCPLVEYAGETLAGNVQGTILESRIIATPDLSDARTLSQACEPLCEGLRQARFHLDEAAVARALEAGRAAYQEFFDTLEQANEKLLARVDGGEFPAALIIGHGYHADEGINHGVDELLGTMGFAVLEQVDYQFARRAAQASSQKGDALWQANVDAFYAAKASENHPHLQLVKIRSFGCGIDALSADKLHDVIRADGRVYAELKMDQIVDLAAVRIRLRSLAYANKQRTEQLACADVPPTFGVFANNLMRAHDFPTYLKSDAAFALLMRKTCAPRSLAPQHIEDIQQAAREQHPEMLDMKLLQFSLVYDGPAEASAAAVTGAGTQGGTDIGADTFDRIVFFGEDGLAFFESWDEVAAYVRFNSAAVERNRQKAEQEKLRRQRLEATRSQKKTPARQDAAAKSEAVNLFKSLYGAGNAQVHSPIGGGNGTAPPNSAANALQAQLERSGKLGEMMADAPKMPAPPGTPSE